MSLITRSIPGLFGGVSQQIAAMRHATHCELQENAISTLVDGLQKRDGFQHIATLAPNGGGGGSSVSGTNGNAFVHIIDRGDAGRYVMIVKDSNMMVYNLATGAVVPISFPNGVSYLNCTNAQTAFRAVTVADYTFLVNREVTVAPHATLSPAQPVSRGLIYVRQAVIKTTYSITVDGTTASYTTGDGVATAVTVASVVAGLMSALAAALPTGYTFTEIKPTGATEGPVISILRGGSLSTAVNASDTFGNTAILAVHKSVATFTDLPASLGSLTGIIIRVTQNPAADKGAYWVSWDPTAAEYKECVAPGVVEQVSHSTMPHKLVVNADGSVTFDRITDWGKRKAGDDETNPQPSFIGQQIRDVFFFRNRLGFLAGDSVCLSKAGFYFAFFADSAQQVLDTDPIDLQSPSEQVITLEWAVPFNEALIIWAYSRQQLVLVAGDILSPKTARLQPTASYAAALRARPEPLGNTCVFASPAAAYTQIQRLQVSSDTVTNRAEDLTEHVPHYVDLDVTQIAASATAKAIAISQQSNNSGFWLFQYAEAQDGSLTQKCWSYHRIAGAVTSGTVSRIMRFYWLDHSLYCIRWIDDPADTTEPGGRFVLEVMSFQGNRTDFNVDFALCMDRKIRSSFASYNAGTNITTATCPYWERGNFQVFACQAGKSPVFLPVLTRTYNTDGTMSFTFEGTFPGYSVWMGVPYVMRYMFTRVFMRDGNGAAVQAARLGLKRIRVRYERTGYFRVFVTPHLRPTYTYEFFGHKIGQIGFDATPLSAGEFSIPVNAQADSTTVEINSGSVLPCVIPYAEWEGNLTMRAQR